MQRVHVGVDFRRLRPLMPKELSRHIQGFADHDRVTGIGVPKVMKTDVFWQPDKRADRSPGRVD